MNLNTYFGPLLSTYGQKKTRLLLTIVIFGMGLASIFILFSMSVTVRMEILRRFHSEGIDLFTVIRRPDAGRVAPAQIRFLNLDFVEWLGRPGGSALKVAPERRLTLPVAYHSLRFSSFIVGSTDAYQSVYDLNVKAGRFLSFSDEKMPHCVIGYRVYRKLRGESGDGLIGQVLHIGPFAFRVIGILQPSKGFESEYSIDESILVPLSTLIQFTQNPEITKINIKTEPKDAISEINEYIRSRLNLYLGDASNYEVSNQQVFFEKIRREVEQITLYLGIAGCLLFFLGIHALVNLISSTVWERQKLFSLYRTFGVKNQKIYSQVLMETLIIGLLSWLIGLLFGGLIMPWLAQYFDWVLIIPLESYWATFVSTFLFCVIAGHFLAQQANRTRLNLMLRLE